MAQEKNSQIAALQAKVDRIVEAGRLGERTSPSRLTLPASSSQEAFLPAGLPAGGIHEIEGASWDAENGIVPTAFIASSLRHNDKDMIFWIGRDEELFAPGICAFGLDPNRLIFCRCRNDAETLAALEDVLRADKVAAAVGELGNVTLTESRRLHLICERLGNTGYLLRRRFYGKVSKKHQGSAATTRWRVAHALSASEAGLVGPPRWRLDLLYRRGGAPDSFLVEWSWEQRRLALIDRLVDNETGAVPRERRDARSW